MCETNSTRNKTQIERLENLFEKFRKLPKEDRATFLGILEAEFATFTLTECTEGVDPALEEFLKEVADIFRSALAGN